MSIKDDKAARRIVIGKTQANEIYLLAITDEANVNSGPQLADLPTIFHELNQNPILNLKSKFLNLINLDGGSASAFYAENGATLTELTSVGSFLCGK